MTTMTVREQSRQLQVTADAGMAAEMAAELEAEAVQLQERADELRQMARLLRRYVTADSCYRCGDR